MPSNPKVLFKFGTRAQYNALETKLENALYFLTDTGELYRGNVPFGQAHVYSGARLTDETDATCITRLVGQNTLVFNDLAIVTNADNSVDSFIYANNAWIRLNERASSSAIATQVATLEGQVSNLETLLNGTPADPEQGTPAVLGLTDRVSSLETQLNSLTGAFHFKGAVADINTVVNPSEGDVYQVGSDEYAWNGTSWVLLGGEFDLSNYVTSTEFETAVGNLEDLIGQPASTQEVIDDVTGEPTTVTTPATGIYADLAENAADIIPTFDGTVSGLVPVAASTFTQAEKASLFMNALGNWVTVSSSGGQGSYVGPDGTVYNTVEEYVTNMISENELVWQSIDE